MFLVNIPLTCCFLTAVLTNPALSTPALQYYLPKYALYPPAEPNYPAVHPFQKSPKLPPRDDILNYEEVPLVLEPHQQNVKLMVRTSSALHPNNFQNAKLKKSNEERKLFLKSKILSPKTLGSQNRETSLKIPAQPQIAPITNPSHYYLSGANFTNVETPKCAIIRCDGPTADDGSIIFAQYEENGNNSCHQTFVPMNSCIGNKGYPVGMVCTICCDCTSSFVSEMHQTRGYKEGFSRK